MVELYFKKITIYDLPAKPFHYGKKLQQYSKECKLRIRYESAEMCLPSRKLSATVWNDCVLIKLHRWADKTECLHSTGFTEKAVKHSTANEVEMCSNMMS